ncbi:capsule assembly Wzi family protein [Dyadobacter sp. CY343]|uniref:capsule assembly Wzi family protein n=1 Tax=Dyadobacter sp. CY343 TaxID=2907299 RepID=UPI001F3E67F5|nr:capsule assembly Wzi family protein [Dyadobacter sp. CY343]MCE7059715.1 capsule assembly Wzi family protein [Dyadobacter sp. CY343]
MKKISFTLVLACAFVDAECQFRNFTADIEAQALTTTKDHVPFWMRSNQNGSIPLSGPSVSLVAAAEKNYDTSAVKLMDWGAGFEGRANGGRSSELILIQGFAKLKIGIFEIKGGRMRETFGLTDTLLTTGNFSVSGNALGIPKIQIAIPEFYAVPIFGKLFAFKGLFAHGWLGDQTIQSKRVDHAKTYFHQKSFYARIGMPDWRFRLYGGFNDQVFWGSEAEIFESFVLTDWQKYQSVVLGKNWAFSKVGNHVGNIDLRLEYDFNSLTVSAYRQSFYEVGALYHLANIADGINGLSILNKLPQQNKLYWKRFVLEMLYTKDQAGESWSKPTPTGNEDYYNHYLYANGWSYRGNGLGTPFITPVHYARNDQASNPRNYFINNRLVAFHLGTDLIFGKWNTIAKFSYSRNYGTHDTSADFQPVNQFSSYIISERTLANNWKAGAAFGLDLGKLLYNSSGVSIKVSKRLL